MHASPHTKVLVSPTPHPDVRPWDPWVEPIRFRPIPQSRNILGQPKKNPQSTDHATSLSLSMEFSKSLPPSLQARADPPLAPREAAAPIACEGKPASRTGPGVRPTGEARPNGRRTVRFVRGRTCTSVGPMMEKPYELEHKLQSRRVCWCDVEVPPLPNPLLASTRHRHLPLRRRQATRGHESRCYES